MAAEAERVLRYREASEAVEATGWRYLLGTLRTAVAVTSLAQASEVVAKAVEACASEADRHLWFDVRAGRVVLVLQSLDAAAVTNVDVELAGRVWLAVREVGLETSPDVGGEDSRAVQLVEIGVDALDIPAVRPFWKAVFAYADEVLPAGPTDALVDPQRQGPAIWFQQMDAPRPQRNRVHFDICVPHDEAQRRISAGLAAGGRLTYDAEAPAFWVLADPEGNEVCITTWQGRQPD
ncbi:4a-hydroxytetrahydrobiopterin dehydratase [Catenulispora sp. NL8]|uniref:4a-hydroxytetrahydrobiopterin dehydratase n=1 Tax=Catenulispora pinistramenti TaxID=2705254 RepID=A0ABS5KRM4_9ACTN|nr:VOC family protein [Catenulispora pinistramenti]MBS2548701.1 4a-hydroxytetrahydrobiopterin dehydratase [Catenulispora pinistramenti]